MSLRFGKKYNATSAEHHFHIFQVDSCQFEILFNSSIVIISVILLAVIRKKEEDFSTDLAKDDFC